MSATTYRNVNPSFNFALSQVFGSSLLKKLGDTEHQNNIKSLMNRSGLCTSTDNISLSQSLEMLYEYLSVHYRCEYVYKNEIANQLLLARHSDNSATLLRELSSAHAVADIVIINGNITAYEIKTELDNFDRLAGQLDAYQALYDALYVVTHDKALPTLEKVIPSSVGIITLGSKNELQTIREAEPCTELFDASRAVVAFRQGELISAYESCVGKLPAMGTALIFNYCRIWYLSLEKKLASKLFYEALKSRRPSPHQFQLVLDCEKSLKMTLLGHNLPKKACCDIRKHLKMLT